MTGTDLSIPTPGGDLLEAYLAIAPDLLSRVGIDPVEGAELTFYGAEDERLMATFPQLEADAEATGVDLRTVIYQGAGHAFVNDTNATAYVASAATDAWTQTLDLLGDRLAPQPAA